MKIALFTGGDDPSYAIPLASALAKSGIRVDFIGNDAMRDDASLGYANVRYLNLRRDQDPKATLFVKIKRLTRYYYKLMTYAASTNAPIIHILWLNKCVYFDRTLLNIYYKLMGRRVVFTAHNINVKERDGGDTFLNRVTLRFMYRLVDHIVVHSTKMKEQLINEYGVLARNVTVIPFGINNHVPSTTLTRDHARKLLGINTDRKVILFFGRIAKYKGLDQLIEAYAELRKSSSDALLIIAGNIKGGDDSYWNEVHSSIVKHKLHGSIVQHIQYIPDENVEIYFKAADVLLLPYRSIFQTGVLFLAYNFGLPAVVTDVGSLKEEIVEGETGFVARPGDVSDLAVTIDRYFKSDLYKGLATNRQKIIDYAHEKYSWSTVAEKTCAVYRQLG